MGKTLHLQVIYKVKLNACAFISVRRLKLDQQIQNAHFSVLLFFLLLLNNEAWLMLSAMLLAIAVAERLGLWEAAGGSCC